jgi:hypothetical protein
MMQQLASFSLSLAAVVLASAGCSSVRQETFESPEKAMAALGDLAASGDRARAKAIFGEKGAESIESGDEVADREDALRFREMLREKLSFEDEGEDRKIAGLGNDAWPLAFPLVREGGRWRFDVDAGLEELFNRRVGRDEILTIATLRACVDAEREYFSEGRDGNPPAYARKFVSDAGRHDGLYWPAAEGQPESPLGPLAAKASTEGYSKRQDGPTPYHGYFYKILTGQSKSAPGGEKSYLDAQGLMTGGFAVVAWPARYRNSGVMTFQVNAQGIVFQKDLGEMTAKLVEDMTVYGPDETWAPAGD